MVNQRIRFCFWKDVRIGRNLPICQAISLLWVGSSRLDVKGEGLINQIEILILGILPKTMEGCYDLFVILPAHSWEFWMEESADRLVVRGFIGLDPTISAQDTVLLVFLVSVTGVVFSTDGTKSTANTKATTDLE